MSQVSTDRTTAFRSKSVPIYPGNKYPDNTYSSLWATQTTLIKRDEKGGISGIITNLGMRTRTTYREALENALKDSLYDHPEYTEVFSQEAIGYV